ncbi:hypothetical protein OS493_000126 [Desmophyllum pertusum]|uniref:Uncharacterized protein n=1 Tax=Desmophyllum pertusum TaxID=174260 RepID=A0A9X0A6N1_9CNID|nr:hypothetical protein OS493_000126 [Desmophyllum pertusum]
MELTLQPQKGYCDRGPGCKNFYYFLVISCLMLLATFLTAIPNKTVVLRCVPDNQRSYSLGFQFIFQRSFGFLPGPRLCLVGCLILFVFSGEKVVENEVDVRYTMSGTCL